MGMGTVASLAVMEASVVRGAQPEGSVVMVEVAAERVGVMAVEATVKVDLEGEEMVVDLGVEERAAVDMAVVKAVAMVVEAKAEAGWAVERVEMVEEVPEEGVLDVYEVASQDDWEGKGEIAAKVIPVAASSVVQVTTEELVAWQEDPLRCKGRQRL